MEPSWVALMAINDVASLENGSIPGTDNSDGEKHQSQENVFAVPGDKKDALGWCTMGARLLHRSIS